MPFIARTLSLITRPTSPIFSSVGVQEGIITLNVKAEALQTDFLTLMRRGAEVFMPLSKAYDMPVDADEHRAEKARVMEAGLKIACDVPLEIMQKCCEAIDMHMHFAKKGAAIAISDVGCGAVCCKAALQAASLNVLINTGAMSDREFAERLNSKTNRLLDIYTVKAD
jgi:formiminotetrahydrofolate cyclodeaminase